MSKPIMIKDVGTAVRIYYSCPELGTKEIMELFSCSHATAIRLKAPVRELQKDRGILTFSEHTVNTQCAYEAWHIDIKEMERRVAKLNKLQMGGVYA